MKACDSQRRSVCLFMLKGGITMACFIVPAAEAIVTTIVARAAKKKEAVLDTQTLTEEKPRFSDKLHWLSNMLWGGSALLMFEHIWHGEVVPWAPFLTAANDPAAAMEMLGEMATVGVGMAALVTAVWGGMAALSHYFEKRSEKAEE